MLRVVKNGMKFIAGRLGYDFVPSRINRSSELRTLRILKRLGIDLIIDIGANDGQFALNCRRIGYRGEILSFEPLRDEHASLLRLAEADPLWTIAERMAVGDHEGQVEINVAGNSQSSSILPMLGIHTEALPESRYIEKQVVPMHRLDDAIGEKGKGRSILLKLDVQGLEPQVLSGASEMLPEVAALRIEMSLVPLYDGEILMAQMSSMLEQKGFQLWDLEPIFRNPLNDRLLQVDGVFVNTQRAAALVEKADPRNQ